MVSTDITVQKVVRSKVILKGVKGHSKVVVEGVRVGRRWTVGKSQSRCVKTKNYTVVG